MSRRVQRKNRRCPFHDCAVCVSKLSRIKRRVLRDDTQDQLLDLAEDAEFDKDPDSGIWDFDDLEFDIPATPLRVSLAESVKR